MVYSSPKNANLEFVNFKCVTYTQPIRVPFFWLMTLTARAAINISKNIFLNEYGGYDAKCNQSHFCLWVDDYSFVLSPKTMRQSALCDTWVLLLQ